MIVILILSILAMVTLPKISNAQKDASESALCSNIKALRTWIEVYQAEHGGRSPLIDERGGTDPGNLVNRLTGRTHPDGSLSATGSCGPYFHIWPANPFTEPANSRKIRFGGTEAPPRSGPYGWYVSLNSCLVSANSPTGGEAFDPPKP